MCGCVHAFLCSQVAHTCARADAAGWCTGLACNSAGRWRRGSRLFRQFTDGIVCFLFSTTRSCCGGAAYSTERVKNCAIRQHSENEEIGTTRASRVGNTACTGDTAPDRRGCGVKDGTLAGRENRSNREPTQTHQPQPFRRLPPPVMMDQISNAEGGYATEQHFFQ